VSGGSQEHLPLSPQSSVTSSGSGGSDVEGGSRRGTGRGAKNRTNGGEGDDPEMRGLKILDAM